MAGGDVASFVAAAGILAHYIGDACQPLHGSYLDDGDPFRNPNGTKAAEMLGHGKGFAAGVHIAYEDHMLDDKVGTLLTKLDQYGALNLGPKPNAAGQHHAADVLWTAFGSGTVKVMADGCKTLAMLWDSAWKAKEHRLERAS